EGTEIRKGAVDAVLNYSLTAAGMPTVKGPDQAAAVKLLGTDAGNAFIAISERIAKAGGTPLAVAKDGKLLGLIHLKDIIKGGIRGRCAELRQMGPRNVVRQ